MCDLFVWLVSLFNKKEATPASTPVAALVSIPVASPVAPTAAVIEGTVV
jgi:hypothetical protein